MDKETRKFNAWLRANEKELTILMNNPEAWEICQKISLDGNDDEQRNEEMAGR